MCLCGRTDVFGSHISGKVELINVYRMEKNKQHKSRNLPILCVVSFRWVLFDVNLRSVLFMSRTTISVFRTRDGGLFSTCSWPASKGSVS
jgi:hypothetical protein